MNKKFFHLFFSKYGKNLLFGQNKHKLCKIIMIFAPATSYIGNKS